MPFLAPFKEKKRLPGTRKGNHFRCALLFCESVLIVSFDNYVHTKYMNLKVHLFKTNDNIRKIFLLVLSNSLPASNFVLMYFSFSFKQLEWWTTLIFVALLFFSVKTTLQKIRYIFVNINLVTSSDCSAYLAFTASLLFSMRADRHPVSHAMNNA